MANFSQRISLEGAEDIVKRQLHELTAGANQRELAANWREMRETGAAGDPQRVVDAIWQSIADCYSDSCVYGPPPPETAVSRIAFGAVRRLFPQV
jgi:hypothetical protein